MRIVIFIISLLIFLVSLIVWYTSDSLLLDKRKTTNIEISPKKIDLGNVKINEIAEGVIFIHNIGNEDLVIDNVQVSCTCSAVAQIFEPISPGDTSLITIKNIKRSLGYFYSDVIIRGNFSGSPVFLSFEGRFIK